MSIVPGCFSVPSVFSFKSKICPKCKHFENCRGEVRDLLHAAPDFLAVRVALIEHERWNEIAGFDGVMTAPVPAARSQGRPSRAIHPTFPLTQDQERIIASMPARVGVELHKLYSRGKDVLIRRSIVAGKPALEGHSGNRSLKVALSALVTNDLTKQNLKAAFVTELGWSDRAAQNEVSMMWHVLTALKVAVENHGRLVIAPSLLTENRCIEA